MLILDISGGPFRLGNNNMNLTSNLISPNFSVLNGKSNVPMESKKLERDSDIFLHFVNIGSQYHTISLHGTLLSDPASPYLDRGTLALFPGATKSIQTRLTNTGDWLVEELTTVPHQTRFYGLLKVPGVDSGSAN